MTRRVPLTPAGRMAVIAADQLRWAEVNSSWRYLRALLDLLHSMGARVIRLHDDRYQTAQRGDYMVTFPLDTGDGA